MQEKLSGKDFEDAIAIWERDVLKLPVASNLLGKISGLAAASARWEKFRFNPPPSLQQLEVLAKVVGAETDRLMEMLPPKGVGMKLSPIRLCAACYGEVPYHFMEWQFKQTDRCEKHSLRLLIVRQGFRFLRCGLMVGVADVFCLLPRW
jgi:hypothetical protein